MIVIPPITITPTHLTLSNVPEPSPGEVVWNQGTSYAVGDVVIRTQTHRKYRAITGGADPTPPEVSALAAEPRWQDVGATNRYAMFDLDRNTVTEAPSPLTVRIKPGQRVTSLAIDNVTADWATVDVSIGGQIVMSSTSTMRTRSPFSWGDYFFGGFGYRSKFVRFNLPQTVDVEITVNFSRLSGPVQAGAFLLGKHIVLGKTLAGSEDDDLDFSVIERAPSGELFLDPGKAVPRNSHSIYMQPWQVPVARQFRKDYVGRAAMFFAVHDEKHPYFDAGAVLGIFRKMTMQLNPKYAIASIDLEGY